jgi:hypothetical protein
MSDCTCSNCIFIGNGMRYCYDCKKHTKLPPRVEMERKIDCLILASLASRKSEDERC